MPKSFEYKGTHTDERAIPGIGWVKQGTIITAIDDSHAEKMKASDLFKQVATPKDEPATTDSKTEQKTSKKEAE